MPEIPSGSWFIFAEEDELKEVAETIADKLA